MKKFAAALALVCVLASFVTFSSALSITQDEINTLLAMHNNARARMGASNMPDLTWDANLATVASNWAAGCTYTHNEDRTTQYDQLAGSTDYVGENIANAANSAGYPSISTTAQFWFNEEQYWSYPNTCSATGSNTCGHWTQIIWANTLRVGCDYVTCPGEFFTKYLVCDYAPGGNYNNENPFVRASPVASTTPPPVDSSTPPTSTTVPTTTATPTTTSTPLDSSVPTGTSTPTSDVTPNVVPSSSAQLQFAIFSCLIALIALLL